ncbi:uncharacterized protein LOC110453848 isoform X2 [Mizuhopecten yessoensis]|uniref:uncharacterized protein LOC110453848 isoform X2 n=1 Tax=Mizuhopecten yessoensis TaxID=6573 RepID=UPI000B45D1B0|nr:uncharacterized protein LOC110453848 isoform X2 [Mizuhopecten yessoensis]
MTGYLSVCQHSMLNRSLLVLTDTFSPRICRAHLPVSTNTCHSTNLFSTTPQNRQKSDFGLRKNFTYCRRNGPGICSSSKYNIAHQSVRFFSEFENDDKKKPVTFSTPKNRIHGGKYTEENILMPETFPMYVFPNFTSLVHNLLSQLIVRKVEKELSIPHFLDAAKKAVLVVANLLSTGNVDEVESLTTSEAFKQIKKNYEKIPATHLEQLALEEDMIHTPVRHIHRVQIKPQASDTSEQEKTKLEILLVLEGYQGKTAEEKPSIFINMANRKRIACTVRFEKEYFKVGEGWDCSAAWKISGISYLIQDTVDEKRENFFI